MLITFFNNYVDEDLFREHLNNSRIRSKRFVFTRYIRLRKYRGNSVPFLFQNKRGKYRSYCFGVMYDVDFDEIELDHLKVMFCDYDFVEIKVNEFKPNYNSFIRDEFSPTGYKYKSNCFVANLSFPKNKSLKENRHLNINYNRKLLLELYKGGLNNELGNNRKQCK